MREQPLAPSRARRRPVAVVFAALVVGLTAVGALTLAGPTAHADVERPRLERLPAERVPVARSSDVLLSLDPVVAELGDLVGLASATTMRMIAEATPPPPPPVACPAPGSEFIDSWGFARSGGRRHKGVDMMAPHGTPVLAPVAGTIRASNSSLGGLGFYLEDDDGNTYFGSHLASLIVSSGRVEAGTQIGTVGSTGNASTPHLHFEVMVAGSGSVNPYPFAAAWCGLTDADPFDRV